jgi:probable F420-dependent oxidoreductase
MRSNDMKIGLSNFPTEYSISAVALARAAEERGFESLWVVEHTHIPASRRTPYPIGGDLPSIYWESYEPFTFLAQAAAVTTDLRVGTGICLVPEHHPIALAKRVASLDALSGGRFLFGVGAGWNAEELENHGVAFGDRWKVLREHVLAMKACWTEKDAEYHGRFVDFDPVWVEPKPVQKPHPPIYIGASSTWAMERIVEYGDGWLPVPVPEFDERLALLNRLCEERGRDRSEIDVCLMTVVDSADTLAGIRDKGVNRVILSLPTLGEDEALRVLDGYANVVEWAKEIGDG